ncbi:MAG: hypothetical protein AMXMBFR42_21640 [Burkholderiales bacterium]
MRTVAAPGGADESMAASAASARAASDRESEALPGPATGRTVESAAAVGARLPGDPAGASGFG